MYPNFEESTNYLLICHYKSPEGLITNTSSNIGKYLTPENFNSAANKLLYKMEKIKNEKLKKYLANLQTKKAQQAKQEADKNALEEFQAAKKFHHENFLLLPIGTPEPKPEDFLKPQQQPAIKKPLIISMQSMQPIPTNPRALISESIKKPLLQFKPI